jgi:hypothetical protein
VALGHRVRLVVVGQGLRALLVVGLQVLLGVQVRLGLQLLLGLQVLLGAVLQVLLGLLLLVLQRLPFSAFFSSSSGFWFGKTKVMLTL